MAQKVRNVNKVNAGLCPHGLPPGACPICSNMAGGLKQSDRNRKIGEMTYHECAMIGNMLKARALAQKSHENNIQHRAENLKNFENNMAKLQAGMLEFAQKISNNFLLKPLVFVVQNIAVPLTNFIQNIPNFITNLGNKVANLGQKLFDITDKIAAVFGELKAVIEKKISEFVSTIATKFKNLFKIFKKHNTDDEDTKIDDDKKIFNLKTILHKIKTKLKKKDKKHE